MIQIRSIMSYIFLCPYEDGT